MCVTLNSLLDRDMKVFFVCQALKQGINIKTMCPNYILNFRNNKSHLFHFYLGVDQERNCHWKSSLFSCWSLLLYISMAIQVHVHIV